MTEHFGVRPVKDAEFNAATRALNPSADELKALEVFKTKTERAFGHMAAALLERQTIVAIHDLVKEAPKPLRSEVFASVLVQPSILADMTSSLNPAGAKAASRVIDTSVEAVRRDIARGFSSQSPAFA